MTDHASLRLALRLNAGFSISSALAILFAYGSLSEIMGIPSPILIGIGVGLLAFAGQLIYTARRSDVAKLRREGLQHSMADFAWVLGSLVVIALDLLTPTGNQILVAVGLPVLALGIAQWRGLPAAATTAS